MPFGLTNAPVTFQHFINDCLKEYLNVFCTAHLDDILINSEMFKEPILHVWKVLFTLRANGVLLKPEKFEFHTKTTRYLRLIISPKGISMDQTKLITIQEWTTPCKVKNVQAFLGFANFYQQFIKEFSMVVNLFTQFTHKDLAFTWTPEAQLSFNTLKKAFSTAPILMHFDSQKAVIIETEASDYVSPGILSQHDDNEVLQPVAFYTKKRSWPSVTTRYNPKRY